MEADMKIKTFEDQQSLETTPFYKNIKSANYAMTHLVNLMGEDVLYVETGVFQGASLCYILQRCDNIKLAIGIDQYKSYTDEFERGSSPTFRSQEQVDKTKQRCYKNILSSGHKDKATLIEEHTSIAINHFDDNSIDFLFLDSYCSKQDVEEELERWYNKVKIGGYFAGHDWVYSGVNQSVNEFRLKYDIKSPLSVMGAEWVWKKEGNI